jgi:hypothetical protein
MPSLIPRTDVLITMMGAPHASDMVTSVLRMCQALLDRGASVQVWACGYATMLTQQGLGDSKPRNLSDWSVDYPSTATIVRRMLGAHQDQMYWYGCRFCSDDRGATAHIPEVRVQPPFKFADHVAAAGKTMFVGVM